jgi:DNA-binding LacI/PurR family transcriptional regulator
MTALARHYRELGELGADLLLSALRGGANGTPAELRVPLELIVRRSCGCHG